MSILRRAALAALLVSIVLLPGCDVTGLLLIGVEHAGEVIFSGGLFDFGNTLPGSAASASFSIVNHGQDDVTLPGTVGISGPDSADFVVSAQPQSTIPAEGSVSFTVDFTPSSAGILERAQATFETDAGIYVVNLVGVGEGSSGQLFMEFDGDGMLDLSPGETVSLYTSGGPVTMTFRINNTHETETLYLVGSPAVVITNPGVFSVTTSPTSPVDAGAFTDFVITFNPPDYGIYQETATVRTTDPTYPEFTFTMYGEYFGVF